MKDHHYYASTCFSWAVAGTRKEAIAKVAKAAGKAAIKDQIKQFGGLYVWSVRVLTPEDTDYAINFYQPVDVPMEATQEFRIVDALGHVIPLD